MALNQVSDVELITVGTSVPRTKRFITAITETGDTLYGIIRRESDGYLLNDATDDFASAPADPYNSFTEDATILGRYAFDSATATWADGWYTCVVYKQAGGSPAPVSDTVVGSGTVLLQADQATDSTGTSETIHAYALCTLAQMHTELNIPTATTADDDRLIRAINAATDAIESHTNRKLKQRASATTECYDGTGGNIMDGGRQLWPDEWPLESGCITSLHDDSARAFGAGTLINSAHYVIRYQRYIELSDIVGPRVFVEAWQNLQLIYTPGYSTVPSDLQKACVIVATDFYLLEKTQKANVSSRSDAAGSHSFKDYALNPTAVLILKPYVRGWQMIPERGAWVR